MGAKKVWNGKQLPEVGNEVLIHLSSLDSWEKYIVQGFHIWPSLNGDTAYHRIFVDVWRTDNGQKVTNSRLLRDIRPIDWRQGEEYNPSMEDK